jgi:signal transduction histidine kinase
MPDTSAFKLGSRLTLTFVALMVLILSGNVIVFWQFQMIHNEAGRLTGANQQLAAVLRLQANLLSYHRQLDDLVRSMDVDRLVAQTESLRGTIRQETQQIRAAIATLPTETIVDPSFLPTLDTIDVTLPAEIKAIAELAKSGDREAMQPRVDNELNPIETLTAILVNSINQQANRELQRGITEMESIQRRILVIVPATALATFLTAAFFGWSIARRFVELRVEERVAERTRMARELHDTLLQDFQASLVTMQAARNLFSLQPEKAVQTLDDAIDAAGSAIDEGRAAIQGLRSVPMASGNLGELLTSTSQDLTKSANTPPVFELIEEGERRTLSSATKDEICRIAIEILRNAYRHANARSIEAEVRYGERLLRLRIRDDGRGMDPKLLEDGGVAGHYGLRGMRERAQRMGARLDLWTEAGAGTEIQLMVPASVAYENSRDRNKIAS